VVLHLVYDANSALVSLAQNRIVTADYLQLRKQDSNGQAGQSSFTQKTGRRRAALGEAFCTHGEKPEGP